MTNTPKPEALASLVERLRFCEEHGLFVASLNDSVASYGEAATALEALAAERDALRSAVIQYRDDLHRPPAPDSKERRLEMIAKLIGKD